MIREAIRPQCANFIISIPTSYIDREVEFIMFPLDEQELTKEISRKSKKSLRGIFGQYTDISKCP